MVRAYTESANLAIDNAIHKELNNYQEVQVLISYPLFEILEREMKSKDIQILNKEFSEQVKCTLRCKIEQITYIKNYFSEIGIQSYVIMD